MKSIKELTERFKTDKKMIFMLVVGALGILLIVISEFDNETKVVENEEEKISFYEYEIQVENRLEDIISQIDNVGRVKVMVTLKSTEENRYAFNETDYIKTDDGLTDSKSENEYVIIKGEKGDECILLKTDFPEVRGVIVVCDGGDNSSVKNDVTNAVGGLLNINSNNISVLKMKNSEE